MGRRGPSPKPTKLNELHGNPGKRKKNTREPQPVVLDDASPPEWLDPVAQEEWRRVYPELQRINLLTVLDVQALAAYCQCYSHWRECEGQIREHGRVVVMRDDKGQVKWMQASPYVKQARDALAQMKAFAGELGFSPASRSRVSTAPDAQETDPAEEWLTLNEGMKLQGIDGGKAQKKKAG